MPFVPLMGVWTEAMSHTAPHYTIDTGRLKEQKTVIYASILQNYFFAYIHSVC